MAAELLNLDMHLARYVADKLRELIAAEAGYPVNYANAEAWKAKLMTIIVPLETYSNKFDGTWDEELAATKAGQQAIRELAEIFPQLWL